MTKDTREREHAAQTVKNGFLVVERIYRHAYQTLMAMKNMIREEYNFTTESGLIGNAVTASDTRSWIYHSRGVCLATSRFDLDKYKEKPFPVLFLQASLYKPSGMEPVIRYGVIKKISNIKPYKGARLEDYFRGILIALHADSQQGNIKTLHCEASISFEERFLLDIREDKDVSSLVETIAHQYIEKSFG